MPTDCSGLYGGIDEGTCLFVGNGVMTVFGTGPVNLILSMAFRDRLTVAILGKSMLVQVGCSLVAAFFWAVATRGNSSILWV